MITPVMLSELGCGVGAIGILLAIIAYRRATRAVAECAALIHGSLSPRGTEEEHAVRAARLGQGLPVAATATATSATVKMRTSARVA